MTIGGIALGFVPWFPNIKLDPEFVILVVLPPLVYSAAVELPWDDFRSNARPISLFAVGLVAVTIVVVAALTHAMISGITWPEAFALGAIVSPTDPVASTAVSQRLGLPRRLQAITQGEGLVNDAVALTALKLATAAALTHSYAVGHIFSRFGAIVVGEAGYGTLVGWVVAKLRKRIADSRVEVAISLATPFLAYLPPESLGGSGVLAAVAAGMYIGIQAPELLSAETRLSLSGAWDVVIYLLEGSLFFLTGLQFRSVIEDNGGPHGATTLLYGAAIIAAVVALRFMWAWIVSWTKTLFFGGAEEQPPARHLVYLGWCGMRGGISLAAALSLPAQFGRRGLMLFLTACVIAGTLILQGGPLPAIVRRLRLNEDARREESESTGSERRARIAGIRAALKRLEDCGTEAARIRDEYQHRLELLQKGASGEADILTSGFQKRRVELALDGIDAERLEILERFRHRELNEHVLSRIQRDLDLREARLKMILDKS
jgi:monovalent cation/hydrogen antiporter